MASTTAVKKTTKTYTYRTGAGGNTNTDVSIEYSADLSALSRLEVRQEVLCESEPKLKLMWKIMWRKVVI